MAEWTVWRTGTLAARAGWGRAGEITASLPASTLSWLATTVSNTNSSNYDMPRVFTAVSRIALSFSLKNTKLNLDTKLSLDNLLSMMSSKMAPLVNSSLKTSNLII